MTENFASCEISKKLIQLGCNEPCIGSYTRPEEGLIICSKPAQGLDRYPAFLYESIFRWFRDKHKLMGVILPYKDGYDFDCIKLNQRSWENLKTTQLYITYQEAQEACIKYLMEIIEDRDLVSEYLDSIPNVFPIQEWVAPTVFYPMP